MKLIIEFTHNDETTRHGIAVKDEYCTLPRHKMTAIVREMLTCTAADIANEFPDIFHIGRLEAIDIKELNNDQTSRNSSSRNRSS